MKLTKTVRGVPVLAALLLAAHPDIHAATGGPGERQRIQLREAFISAQDEDALDRFYLDIEPVVRHLHSGDYAVAKDLLLPLIEQQPRNPILQNLMGAAELGLGSLAPARERFERALEIDPAFITAARNLAKLDAAAGDLGSAQRRFERVLEADPDNIAAMLGLSEVAARRSGRVDGEALEWLERARLANPAAIPPRQRLAEYFKRRQRYAEAIEVARELVAAHPNRLDAHSVLADVYTYAGRAQAAGDVYRRALELVPESSDVRVRLAGAQALAGEGDGAARETLAEALEIEPLHAGAQTSLAALHVRGGDAPAARAIARAMREQPGNEAEGWRLEGDIAVSERDYPAAVAAYDKAQRLEPTGEGATRLFRARVRAGDTEPGVAALAKWVERHPRDLATRRHLADAYLQLERHADARDQYEAYLAREPLDAGVLNNLANVLLALDEGEAAREAAERALAMDPENPLVGDTLGWVLLQTAGDPERAVSLLEKAAEAAPGLTAINYHLAVGLARIGRKDEARERLGAVVASDEPFAEREAARRLLETL